MKPKMLNKKLFIVLFVSLVTAENKVFEPCRASDPNLNRCLKDTAQKLIPLLSAGIPEIGVDPIVPYHLNDIVNSVSASLRFEFTDVLIYGRNTTKINDIKIDLKKKTIDLDFTSDDRMVSKYLVNGTLLIIQVAGNGPCFIDIVKANYKMNIKYDIVKGKDGKDHWKIISHDSTANPGRMIFKFDNLFNGNKILSDAVHKFVNDYWKDIYDEFGGQIIKKLVNKTAKQIGKLFAAIPAEDMMLPFVCFFNRIIFKKIPLEAFNMNINNFMLNSALSMLVIFVTAECKQSFFQPCRASDPDLNKCVTNTAQKMLPLFLKGVPDIKLDSFNPYTVEDIHSKDLGIIEFHFTNNVIHRASTNKIKYINLDPQKHTIEISVSSTGDMISNYRVNGTLIIFPVTGEGRSNLTIVDTEYLYKLNYDIVKGKDGKDHWKIVKQQATYSPKRLIFSFENLFGGNKQLSDVVHQFANENWKDILNELGTPIMARITKRTVKQIGRFLSLIPAEDFQTFIPNFIPPCSKSDPNLNECLVATINKVLNQFSHGISDLNVPKLDPVKLNRVSIEIPGLSVIFDNSTLTGLGDGRVSDYKLNFEKGTLKMDYLGNVTMKGHYKINGRVLILPIVGDGDYTNTITNLRLIMKYSIKTVKQDDDGKDHWNLELVKRSYKVDKAQFDFKNLFGGNKVLADTTLLFLNQNWEIIMKEVSPPAIDQIVQICLDAVNKFYAKVPINDLFSP
ncbi:uncharacterized protein LOC143914114 [Arctopsyche grandis]|uniref:uncharacterized protein LOC143914114 n=1 Tax=Arctopsyche grandis TaxID=121162 RepID=UPI00406D824F